MQPWSVHYEQKQTILTAIKVKVYIVEDFFAWVPKADVIPDTSQPLGNRKEVQINLDSVMIIS